MVSECELSLLNDNEPVVTPLSHDFIPSNLTFRLMMTGGAIAAVIGCIAMLGWLLALPRLTSLGQGLIPMAPSTAALFIAYGGALLLLRRAARERGTMLIIRSTLAFGSLISMALFFLSINGVFLAAEHLGFKVMGAVEGSPIGHMSPITAITFLLVGLSFRNIITARPSAAWRGKTAWWLAILVIVAYVMLMLAYLFGTPMFYGGTFIPPAATTSIAFLALGVSLLSLAQPLAWPGTVSNGHNAYYTSNVLIVVFLLLAAGIISAGYFYHRKHEKHYLSEVERQLSTIADLKMGELLLWREERLADAGLFHNNIAFANLVKSFIKHPESKQARLEIDAWGIALKSKRNYNRIFLLDALAMNRWSHPEAASEPLSKHVRQKAIESLQTGRITVADFYRNEISGKIYLSILVPVFDPVRTGEPLGVIVMRIDPDKYLYPFIKRWPVSSATAETLLVRREGNAALFLNELRFKKDSALNLRVPLEKTEVPAVMAALGREGVVRGIDYRGHSVLAALRNIPDSPWRLVTRIDIEEVYAPLRERLWITVLLAGAMLLAAGTGIGFVWRRQSSQFYRDKYEAELKRVELEERLTRIAANLPGAIFQLQLRPDGVFRMPYVSSGLEALYGLRPEDVVLDISRLFGVIHPDDAARVNAAMLESAGTLSVWHNEHRVINPERGPIWVEGSATPELKPDGSVLLHGFLAEITERKQREREIEKKNSELERFTYTVSHDLKSPLVTIKTFMGYLEEDIRLRDEGRIQQDLGFMHNAADKMSQLLDELLELSRVGRLGNLPEEVAFRDLAREAVSLDAGRISERGVAVEIGDTPLVLVGDRSRLVEIWQNLVENACKFMGDQETPRIEIGVEGSGPETLFFVRDNGIGIDPRFHSKVFGLFEKLEAGGDGTGLGLALVKRIVELYDGTIRVESAGTGKGTTIFFTLPTAIKK